MRFKLERLFEGNFFFVHANIGLSGPNKHTSTHTEALLHPLLLSCEQKEYEISWHETSKKKAHTGGKHAYLDFLIARSSPVLKSVVMLVLRHSVLECVDRLISRIQSMGS